jgi:hypothetical protein
METKNRGGGVSRSDFDGAGREEEDLEADEGAVPF